MARLLHEVWEDDGSITVCFAGPQGEAARSGLSPQATLVRSFVAGSHFEAMTLHHQTMGWEPYSTEHEWDTQPYPDEWQGMQRKVIS
jgi:hypothetical protein